MASCTNAREWMWLNSSDSGSKYDGRVRAFVLGGSKKRRIRPARRDNKANRQPTTLEPDTLVQDVSNPMSFVPNPTTTKLLSNSSYIDPFESLPVIKNKLDHALVYHYLEYTASRYGLNRSGSFTPARDLFFPILVHSELGMLGMMNYSSASLDRHQKLDQRSMTSTIYRSRYLSCIQSRMNTATSHPSEDILIAVGGALAAVTETKYGILDEADEYERQTHLHGLQSLMSMMGGWPLLISRNNLVSWFMCWTDICNSGYFSSRLSIFPPSNPLTTISYSSNPLYRLEGKTFETPPRHIQLKHEFLAFYRTFWEGALHYNAQSHIVESLESRESLRWFIQYFRVDGLASRFLQKSGSLTISRIAPLLYSCILYVGSVTTSSVNYTTHLLRIELALEYAGSDAFKSFESFYWILTTDRLTQKMREPSTVELLGRMISVYYGLHHQHQQALADSFLFILGNLEISNDPEQNIIDVLSPEELEDIVLGQSRGE